MTPYEDGPSPDTAASAGQEDPIARERDELRDRLLRVTAEFDNFRKRTDRERREWTEQATADVIRDVLPIVDDLERALTAPTEGGSDGERLTSFRSGLSLIHRQWLELMRRRGVEPLNVVGEDFNPEWHEALAKDALDGRREGEVTAEVRRGYRLGSRLLRPALVRVAQA